MKTKKTTARSFSVDLVVPRSWAEMTDEQLRFALRLRLKGYDDTRLKLQCLLHFNKVTVVKQLTQGWLCRLHYGFLRSKRFYVQDWQLHSFLKHLSYMSDPGSSIALLHHIGKYTAIDARLHSLSFEEYLICENNYQGYLYTKNPEMLRHLSALLYRDKEMRRASNIKLSPVEGQAVLQWYYAVKQLFARKFKDFFQRVDDEGSEVDTRTPPNMEALMNAQIRALTGGDITKENIIFKMNVWRALTELNEKAREAKELEKIHSKYGRKK